MLNYEDTVAQKDLGTIGIGDLAQLAKELERVLPEHWRFKIDKVATKSTRPGKGIVIDLVWGGHEDMDKIEDVIKNFREYPVIRGAIEAKEKELAELKKQL